MASCLTGSRTRSRKDVRKDSNAACAVLKRQIETLHFIVQPQRAGNWEAVVGQAQQLVRVAPREMAGWVALVDALEKVALEPSRSRA